LSSRSNTACPVGLAQHGLAVHHLRLADVGGDAVLAAHAVDDDLEVQLAHAPDDGLAGVGVLLDAEGRILVDHLGQREVEPLLGGVVLGLDRLRDHGLVGVDPLEEDRGLRVAQGVAGGGVLEPGGGDDLAGHRLVEALALVGVDAEQARHLLLLAGADVQELVAGREGAGEDAQEHDLAALVHRDLEGQGGQRLAVLGLAGELVLGLARIDAGDRRHVGRRRQVVDDRVEERMDPLVAQRGAAQDRHDLHRDHRPPQRRLELGHRQLGALEVLLGDRVVGVGDRRDQALAGLGDRAGQLVGHRSNLGLGVELAGEVQRLLGQQIDHALEGVLAADRELDRHRVGAQALLDLGDDVVERRADAVELVDEGQAGDMELVGLVPHRLGLRLDPADRAEHHDRAVEDPQRALDLDREVDMAGGVDQVDLVLAPLEGRGRGGDGDAALPLLLHPVHLGLAVVDLAGLVDLAGVEEEPLGHRGLASVDVGDDPDVANLVDLGHGARSIARGLDRAAALAAGRRRRAAAAQSALPSPP
jgi:hypothetical protein